MLPNYLSFHYVYVLITEEASTPNPVTTTESVTSSVTTTESVTSSGTPTIILSPPNDSLLTMVLVIAGSSIGVCLLAAISAIIILKKIRLSKANKVVPKNKRNASPKASQLEILEGDIQDFKVTLMNPF